MAPATSAASPAADDVAPLTAPSPPAASATDERATPEADEAGEEERRLLMLDLDAVGVDATTARVISSLVSQTLAQSTSLEVVTSRDLSAMVDLEAERQATGCDTVSCLAEVAGAMGTRYVVFGSVGRVAGLTVLELSLFDSIAAKPVARRQARHAEEAGLVQQVDFTAASLVIDLVDEDDPIRKVAATKPVVTTAEPEAAEPTEPAAGGLGVASYALFGTGAAAAIAGLAVGVLGAGYFLYSSLALNNWAPAPAAMKNSVLRFGLWGLLGPAVAVALVGGGALAAGAGFLVE